MPDKTQGELIREARESLALLKGQAEADRETIRDWQDEWKDRLNKVQDRFTESVRKVDLLEHQVAELKKDSADAKQWRRSLVGPILGGVVGSLLTALLALLVQLLRH